MVRSTTQDNLRRLAALRERSLQGIRAKAGGLRTAGLRDGVEYMEIIGPVDARDILAAFSLIGAPLIWITDAHTMHLLGANGCDGPGAPVRETVMFGPLNPATILHPAVHDRRLHDAGQLRTAVFLARELARNGDHVLLAVEGQAGPSADFHQAVKDL
jgi:hypothetical protein